MQQQWLVEYKQEREKCLTELAEKVSFTLLPYMDHMFHFSAPQRIFDRPGQVEIRNVEPIQTGLGADQERSRYPLLSTTEARNPKANRQTQAHALGNEEKAMGKIF